MKFSGKQIAFSITALVIILIVLAAVITGHKLLYRQALNLPPDEETSHIYIHTGWDFEDVIQMLKDQNILKYPRVFEKTAVYKKYPERVKPGRYKITSGMSNLDMLNMLQSGRQDPVNVVFNNIRTPQQLAGRIAHQIEADSLSILNAILDSTYHQKFNIPLHQIAVMFIPNTYEFFWNTSADGFIERMYREYLAFWNSQRQEKLSQIKLTQAETVTLASIIEMETRKNDEKARIAGVYMNRLRIGMRLQADPTLVFAHGDFSLRRVLNKHKLIDSPYNTYMYAGLPPGPISFPSIASVDAVLNYENHDYLYFAAKEDFSGYHNFSRTYQQHLENARRFHKALNDNNIR